MFTASTHDYILFFTDTGKAYRKKGYQIPESGRAARGTAVVNVLRVENGERVQTMIHTRDISDGENRYLTMITRGGTVKRLPANSLRNLRNNGIRVITLEENDRLIAVRETDGTQDILIATRDGQAIRFHEENVRPMGRSAVGVRGIRLREGDYVVGADCAVPGHDVLTVTGNGYGKRTPTDAYPVTNRAGLGVINYNVTEKTGKVIGVMVVDTSEDLLLVTQDGVMLRTPVADIKQTSSRSSMGVIVMRFRQENDHVISIALAQHEEPDPLPPSPETLLSPENSPEVSPESSTETPLSPEGSTETPLSPEISPETPLSPEDSTEDSEPETLQTPAGTAADEPADVHTPDTADTAAEVQTPDAADPEKLITITDEP